MELTDGATVASLDRDRTRREALLWSFTVLGEASSQLGEQVKSSYPQVPWRAASSLRNRIVHGYWQISTSILLATAQDDIPCFLRLSELSGPPCRQRPASRRIRTGRPTAILVARRR